MAHIIRTNMNQLVLLYHISTTKMSTYITLHTFDVRLTRTSVRHIIHDVIVNVCKGNSREKLKIAFMDSIFIRPALLKFPSDACDIHNMLKNKRKTFTFSRFLNVLSFYHFTVMTRQYWNSQLQQTERDQ